MSAVMPPAEDPSAVAQRTELPAAAAHSARLIEKGGEHGQSQAAN